MYRLFIVLISIVKIIITMIIIGTVIDRINAGPNGQFKTFPK